MTLLSYVTPPLIFPPLSYIPPPYDRLQAGKFDAADRLFCSIADAWASVTSNPADVKELIPEFYLPNTDFLVNKENLALGMIWWGVYL